MEESALDPSHQLLQHTIEQDLLLWKTTANLMEIDEVVENMAEPLNLTSSQLPFFIILLRRSQDYIRNLFANFKNRDQQ